MRQEMMGTSAAPRDNEDSFQRGMSLPADARRRVPALQTSTAVRVPKRRSSPTPCPDSDSS